MLHVGGAWNSACASVSTVMEQNMINSCDNIFEKIYLSFSDKYVNYVYLYFLCL